MVRRISMIAAVGTALAAAPALATPTPVPHFQQLNTPMKYGVDTYSRSRTGSCRVTTAADGISLIATCPSGGSATLVYRFAASGAVMGKNTCALSKSGTIQPSCGVSVSGSGVTATVRIAGHGSAKISSITVIYYTT
ncbi:MAG: hypothetical protein ACTHNU_07450 [Gaiellales bacterium]